MTPASTALLFRLRKDRDMWHAWATEDEATTPTRYMAQARRDLLDNLLQTLPADLEAIEKDAVDGADAEAEQLERVLGW